MSNVTPENIKLGGKYKYKFETEEDETIIYTGSYGPWFQFVKQSNVRIILYELKAEDLKLIEKVCTPIKTWSELDGLESDTHYIKVEGNCFGWIINKATGEHEFYLSTHTFYKKSGLAGSKVFEEYGFDIEVVAKGE